MSGLVVIVPSRGRPQAAAELAEAFDKTCDAGTRLVFAIDKRDVASIDEYPHDAIASTWWSESSTMVEALNMRAAELLAGEMPTFGKPFAIGFMGDDHRPRTRGWDSAYLEALHDLGTGIVYGNDLLQGRNLPTQCAMTADIVAELGHMAPPTLRHMYVDNYWRDLGQRAGCLRYLPDVIVEHMHPIAGKADWDAGHLRVNDQAMYSTDEAAYRAYCAGDLMNDVARVRVLRGAR